MYTTDGFASDAKFLRSDTAGCHWAKSSDLFATGQKDLDDDRILCVVKGRFSSWKKDYRLVISDNYFKDKQEFEPELEPGRTVQGVVNMAVIKKYLIVAVSAEGTDEMALYISDDTIKWHKAVFPHDHKLIEESYTVLEGTNYSIQIDVMNSRPSTPMGVLLSSNSNGTYFTRNIEHTNRNREGFVDFEKVTGIQGIFLVNTVKNFKEVEESLAPKELITQITFDDGRTFQPLKYEDEHLHLHSVTYLTNSGRVFSSPAPGLVMGIGNTGSHLKDYDQGNLYVSDDAGVTWRLGLKGPHKYEFGDSGSILVAVKDSGPVDEVRYSLNHGKDWEKVDLESKIKPMQLTTTKDSTSLKFILEGIEDEAGTLRGHIVALDFDDMHERKCKDDDDDMENWSARVDKDGNPTCLMGHTQTYRRRKADADCFIKNEFVDPVPISVPCDCTDEDFECDFNFVRSEDRKECIPAGAPIIPEGACDAFGPETTFMASSGWRKIPGNDCKKVEGKKYKDDPVERKCVDAAKPPSSGKISHTLNPFIGDLVNHVYLERTGVSSGEDETVIMQTTKGVFLSHDHGKEWKEIPELVGEKILAIIPHTYFNDVVYFVTFSKKVFYSIDRGNNVRSFKAPHPPTEDRADLPIMSFHPKNKDWIIWTGAKDCESSEGCHNVASLTKDRGDAPWQTLKRYVRKCEFIKEPENKIKDWIIWTGAKDCESSEGCHNVASLTKDRGDAPWQTLKRYVRKCEFIKEPENKIKDLPSKERRERLIYCEVNEREEKGRDIPLLLVSSDNFFEDSRTVHFSNVVDFATMSEFIVVATRDDEHATLKASTSVDGQTFAEANFPHGFIVEHQKGYTVLDSSTHSVFLHVTVNNEPGLEYGTIIKSNSNGTSYALSLNAVDRDTLGYVDFEKMFGIEGLAMVNVVANYDSKNYAKEGKRLKTMITHNDGAEWSFLPPPDKDAEGKKFNCKGDLEKCSLNIHGYTERSEKAHTFYSTSAPGLMMGVGNVGQYLTDLDDADTFMTSDAGITWKSAKKGRYMWEFGDQGSILVLVREKKPTNVVHYSLDEGDTWLDYEFSDHELNVFDITTVPSDNARNFLLWAHDGDKFVTINLDFTGLTDVQCKLDENDVLAGDYEIWTPKHPNQDDDCLFGHISQYHRKKKTSECYNGRMIPRLHDIAKNCTCTRRDYEWSVPFLHYSL
jgi:hypothetical protein